MIEMIKLNGGIDIFIYEETETQIKFIYSIAP